LVRGCHTRRAPSFIIGCWFGWEETAMVPDGNVRNHFLARTFRGCRVRSLYFGRQAAASAEHFGKSIRSGFPTCGTTKSHRRISSVGSNSMPALLSSWSQALEQARRLGTSVAERLAS
jgi:hypothetical protein